MALGLTAWMLASGGFPSAAHADLTWAQKQAVSDGRKFEISVTPPATERTSFTTLTVRCRVGTMSKTFHAFVAVQRPMPPTVATPPVVRRSPAPTN